MEEYLSFIDTFSAYVLYNLDWTGADCQKEAQQEFEAQWSLLRRATLYVMRHYEGQSTLQHITEGRNLFMAYGKRVEEVRSTCGLYKFGQPMMATLQ